MAADSVPLLSPVGLQSRVLSTTTVWLQWTDPSIGRDQSAHDSRYYNVHYQAIRPFGKALSAVVRDRHVILYNLAPATRYEFKVRTVKGTETSNYSATVTSRTFETGNAHTLWSVLKVGLKRWGNCTFPAPPLPSSPLSSPFPFPSLSSPPFPFPSFPPLPFLPFPFNPPPFPSSFPFHSP